MLGVRVFERFLIKNLIRYTKDTSHMYRAVKVRGPSSGIYCNASYEKVLFVILYVQKYKGSVTSRVEKDIFKIICKTQLSQRKLFNIFIICIIIFGTAHQGLGFIFYFIFTVLQCRPFRLHCGEAPGRDSNPVQVVQGRDTDH